MSIHENTMCLSLHGACFFGLFFNIHVKYILQLLCCSLILLCHMINYLLTYVSVTFNVCLKVFLPCHFPSYIYCTFKIVRLFPPTEFRNPSPCFQTLTVYIYFLLRLPE